MSDDDDIDLAALLAEEDDFADDDFDEDAFLETTPKPKAVEPEPEPVYEDDEPARPARKKGESRRPQMSGHCAFPQTDHPEKSHERCTLHGAGNRAVPTKEFAPCPCPCHLGEEYECGNCGREIRETEFWTGDGEVSYVHVDHSGRAIGEDCR